MSHLSASDQLAAPGLRTAGVVFIDLWYHMKPRKPSPCVGKALEKKNFLPEELQKPAVLPPEYILTISIDIGFLGFSAVTVAQP